MLFKLLTTDLMAQGVETVHLHGRLEILLCPLSDVIPCFTAIQFAFINPPMLELDFTYVCSRYLNYDCKVNFARETNSHSGAQQMLPTSQRSMALCERPF